MSVPSENPPPVTPTALKRAAKIFPGALLALRARLGGTRLGLAKNAAPDAPANDDRKPDPKPEKKPGFFVRLVRRIPEPPRFLRVERLPLPKKFKGWLLKHPRTAKYGSWGALYLLLTIVEAPASWSARAALVAMNPAVLKLWFGVPLLYGFGSLMGTTALIGAALGTIAVGGVLGGLIMGIAGTGFVLLDRDQRAEMTKTIGKFSLAMGAILGIPGGYVMAPKYAFHYLAPATLNLVLPKEEAAHMKPQKLDVTLVIRDGKAPLVILPAPLPAPKKPESTEGLAEKTQRPISMPDAPAQRGARHP